MTHKFRKGDRIGVLIDYFNAYIPAEVTSVDNNLINVKTEKSQTFTVNEQDAVPLKLIPRPQREVVRVFTPKEETSPAWKGYKAK
jgi:hypothetical protein